MLYMDLSMTSEEESKKKKVKLFSYLMGESGREFWTCLGTYPICFFTGDQGVS